MKSLRIAFALFLSSFVLPSSAASNYSLSFCEAELTPQGGSHRASEDYIHFLKLFVQYSSASKTSIQKRLQTIAEAEKPANPILIAKNTREQQLKQAFEALLKKWDGSNWASVQSQIKAFIGLQEVEMADREAQKEDTSYISNLNVVDETESLLRDGKPVQITVGSTSYVVISNSGRTTLFLVDLKTGAIEEKNTFSDNYNTSAETSIYQTPDQQIFIATGSNKRVTILKINSQQELEAHQPIETPEYVRSIRVFRNDKGAHYAFVRMEKSVSTMVLNNRSGKFESRAYLGKIDSLHGSTDLFFKDGRAFFIAFQSLNEASLFEIDTSSFDIVKQSKLPYEFRSQSDNRIIPWNIQSQPQSFQINGVSYLAASVRSEQGTPGTTSLEILAFEERKVRNKLGWPVTRMFLKPLSSLKYKFARYNTLHKIEQNGATYFVTNTETSFHISEFNAKTQSLEPRGSTPVKSEPRHFDYLTSRNGNAYGVGYTDEALLFFQVNLAAGDFVLIDRYGDLNTKAQSAPTFLPGDSSDFIAVGNSKLVILSTIKKLKDSPDRRPNAENEKDCESHLSPAALSYISLVEVYFENFGAKAKAGVLKAALEAKSFVNPFLIYKETTEALMGAAIERLQSRITQEEWTQVQVGLQKFADKRASAQKTRESEKEETKRILDLNLTFTEPGPRQKSSNSAYITTHGRTFVSYSSYSDQKINLFELNTETGSLGNYESFDVEHSEQHGPIFFKLPNDDAYLISGTGDQKVRLFQIAKRAKKILDPIFEIEIKGTPHVFMPLRLSDGRQIIIVDSFEKEEPKNRHFTVLELIKNKIVNRGETPHHFQLTGRALLLAPQSPRIEVMIAGGGNWQRFDLDPLDLKPEYKETKATKYFDFGVPKRFLTSRDQIDLAYYPTKEGLHLSSPTATGVLDPVIASRDPLGEAPNATLVQTEGRDLFVLRGTDHLSVEELIDSKTTKLLGKISIKDCFRYIGAIVTHDSRILITCTDLHKIKIYTFDLTTNSLEFSQQYAAGYDQTPFFVVNEEQIYMITLNNDSKTFQVFRLYRKLNTERAPNSTGSL